jgi:putative endonuclease
MSGKQYCIYILTNKNHTVLYTGVTNNLMRRVWDHKNKVADGFTKKYNVDRLVYFECGGDINAAILREKQIKAGSRKKKLDLINDLIPAGKIYTMIFCNVIACTVRRHACEEPQGDVAISSKLVQPSKQKIAAPPKNRVARNTCTCAASAGVTPIDLPRRTGQGIVALPPFCAIIEI